MNKVTETQYNQCYPATISCLSKNILTLEQRLSSYPLKASKPASLKGSTSMVLTIREMDIVNCLLNGKTAKQTAKDLLISPRTVERHLENIRTKLNCKNKFDIVNKVLQSSLYPSSFANQGSMSIPENAQLSA